MNFRRLIAPLCFTLLFLACGPQQRDQVMVTVLTPIGMGKKFHQLTEELLSPNATLFNSSLCLQQNIYVGTNDEVNSNRVTTQLVKIYSDPSASYTDAVNALENQSYLAEPIQIPVLKGKPVEVGILGAFYKPIDANADGLCDQLNAATSSDYIPHVRAIENSSLIGHTVINITSDQTNTVALPIWVMRSAQSTAIALPTSTVNVNTFSCRGGVVSSSTCSANDLVGIFPSNATTLSVISVEYFKSEDNASVVHQDIYGGNSLNYYYIPHFEPFTITSEASDGTVYTDVLTDTTATITHASSTIAITGY